MLAGQHETTALVLLNRHGGHQGFGCCHYPLCKQQTTWLKTATPTRTWRSQALHLWYDHQSRVALQKVAWGVFSLEDGKSLLLADEDTGTGTGTTASDLGVVWHPVGARKYEGVAWL